MARLHVGIETGCLAPLWIERASMRFAKLVGVDSLLLPDPNEVPPAAFAEAERVTTPELVGDGLYAGSVNEVVDEIKPLVGAELKDVVIWNIGMLATGGTPVDRVRQTRLVWRLKKLQANGG